MRHKDETVQPEVRSRLRHPPGQYLSQNRQEDVQPDICRVHVRIIHDREFCWCGEEQRRGREKILQ